MCVCVCVCVCISIYCQAQIDASLAINLSEIFHSGLYYSSHLIYLFFGRISKHFQMFFTSCLFAKIMISLHCFWKGMFLWCSHSSWGDFAFDFYVFFLCWNREHSLLPLFPLHTHIHTHNTHTHTHTHCYSSHLFSRSRNIVKVI